MKSLWGLSPEQNATMVTFDGLAPAAPSEYGTYKTVKARFWPYLSDESPFYIVPFSPGSGCSTEGSHRKADVGLPGKENSNSPGARPVHLIITMI